MAFCSEPEDYEMYLNVLQSLADKPPLDGQSSEIFTKSVINDLYRHYRASLTSSLGPTVEDDLAAVRRRVEEKKADRLRVAKEHVHFVESERQRALQGMATTRDGTRSTAMSEYTAKASAIAYGHACARDALPRFDDVLGDRWQRLKDQQHKETLSRQEARTRAIESQERESSIKREAALAKDSLRVYAQRVELDEMANRMEVESQSNRERVRLLEWLSSAYRLGDLTYEEACARRDIETSQRSMFSVFSSSTTID
eukprot:PhM_4_TR16424/c0_g1_i1/m.40129